MIRMLRKKIFPNHFANFRLHLS